MKHLLDAIKKRESRRDYLRFPIEKEKVAKLNELIESFNDKNNFTIKLVVEDDELFKSFISSYGLLNGVRNYFALICKKNDYRIMEMLGYYGQLLVLEATNMGLSTCWVGGTYDKAKAKSSLNVKDDEELTAIIVVGYSREDKGLKEKITKTLTKRKTKDVKEMYYTNEVVPENFINGIRAVQKAPSAMNKQPVYFTYNQGKVIARVNGNNIFNALDLGIALLHFKIGSQTPNDWYYEDDHYSLIL